MSDSRRIGQVRHVRGSTVVVELDPLLAGVTPIWEGNLYPIAQVGSLVEIPQGPVRLLASVTLVGIAELSGALEPSASVQVGDRWLQVQLLGEIDGLGTFHRGVSTYPGMDDPVNFTTAAELEAVFPAGTAEYVPLGRLSFSSDVLLSLKAQPFVSRHAALVGSTGAGKTSAVSSVLQSFARNGWDSANIVVVDPHGEYSAAFEGVSVVRSVRGVGESLLRVPYWALPANEIARTLCGSELSGTFINRFSELVVIGRRKYAASADWVQADASAISPDSPIPFDIFEVWFQLDYENNAVFAESQGKGDPQVEKAGDPKSLIPTEFKAYGMGTVAPFKGPTFGHYGTAPNRMRTRLLDPRFKFLLEPTGESAKNDPLVSVIQSWLGDARPISVLDFSGVPPAVTDVAIGAMLQLIFELAVWSETDGIGKPRPVFIVLEEAHRYLGSSITTDMAKIAVNRIAREGRKYGVGLFLVTQRPSELPETALSQMGTIIALRLTNGTDQSTVKAALPDAVAGLAEALPSLRTGEAIVVGEAVSLPTRCRITPPSPKPAADDPSLAPWRKEPSVNEVEGALARWRGNKKE